MAKNGTSWKEGLCDTTELREVLAKGSVIVRGETAKALAAAWKVLKKETSNRFF